MSVRNSDAVSTDPRSHRLAQDREASGAELVTTWTTKVLDANQEALDVLGVQSTQLIGKPLAVFVDLVERTAFRARLRTVPLDGGCKDWHLSLRRPDGGQRAVIADVEPANSDATIEAHCDLRWSLRIDAEAVPKVARGDVDELIGKLAHDLNQPLAAIVSYARGCLMRLHKKTLNDADLEMVLEQIVAEALRAGATIRECRGKDPSK